MLIQICIHLYFFSARELGISIYNLNVIFPQNPVSLIGSKPGMMYLELFGPSEEFLQSLQGSIEAQPSELILSKLSELQNRLRHGLPIISKYLAGYLITWDGLESRQMVFDLIKWAHFDTFAGKFIFNNLIYLLYNMLDGRKVFCVSGGILNNFTRTSMVQAYYPEVEKGLKMMYFLCYKKNRHLL